MRFSSQFSRLLVVSNLFITANLTVFSITSPSSVFAHMTNIYRPLDTGEPDPVLKSQPANPSESGACRLFTSSPRILYIFISMVPAADALHAACGSGDDIPPIIYGFGYTFSPVNAPVFFCLNRVIDFVTVVLNPDSLTDSRTSSYTPLPTVRPPLSLPSHT